MNKNKISVLVASLMLLGSVSANANVYWVGPTGLGDLNPLANPSNSTITHVIDREGAFVDYYNFTIPLSNYTSNITGVAGTNTGVGDLLSNFYSVDVIGLNTFLYTGWSLDDAGAGINLNQYGLFDMVGAGQTIASSNYGNYAAGKYTLQVVGTATGPNGSAYGGFINLAQPLPVPEPETYAMVLAGLGIISFAARRRNAK